MEKTLTGNVALVTGSGRGLGRAMAQLLSDLGAAVAVHDISQDAPAEFGEAESLDAVAEEIAQRGGREVVAVTGDIASESAVAGFTREVEAALGPVTILVNCAGGDIAARGGKPAPNDALHIKLEDIRAIVDRNLIGTMLMSQAVVRGMVERRRGAIVTMASNAGRFLDIPLTAAYAAAKAGIVMLTRHAAKELGPDGVRVNCVAPATTLTGRVEGLMDEDTRAGIAALSPLGRLGAPEDSAWATLYLASDAASYLTGVTIDVAGGRIML
jgi:3-oxoacyl-[acyl-carrier protein] reductase